MFVHAIELLHSCFPVGYNHVHSFDNVFKRTFIKLIPGYNRRKPKHSTVSLNELICPHEFWMIKLISNTIGTQLLQTCITHNLLNKEMKNASCLNMIMASSLLVVAMPRTVKDSYKH